MSVSMCLGVILMIAGAMVICLGYLIDHLLARIRKLRSALLWIAQGKANPDAGEDGAVLTARNALLED